MDELLSLGIKKTHAYTMTRLTALTQGSEVTQLVRLRNPWGEGEWTGPYSDSSPEMKALDAETKKALGLVVENDGEFWIELKNVIRYFCQIDCCYWFPDDKIPELAKQFSIQVHHSKWSVADKTAGGKSKELAFFCKAHELHISLIFSAETMDQNPQFTVNISGGDEKGQGTLFVSLQIKVGLKETAPKNTFAIYKVGNPTKWASGKYTLDFFTNTRENPRIALARPEASEKEYFQSLSRVSL